MKSFNTPSSGFVFIWNILFEIGKSMLIQIFTSEFPVLALNFSVQVLPEGFVLHL